MDHSEPLDGLDEVKIAKHQPEGSASKTQEDLTFPIWKKISLGYDVEVRWATAFRDNEVGPVN